MICAENLIDLLSFLEQSDISDAMTLVPKSAHSDSSGQNAKIDKDQFSCPSFYHSPLQVSVMMMRQISFS